MRSIEQLTEEILSLPSELRALLADKLVESLEMEYFLATMTGIKRKILRFRIKPKLLFKHSRVILVISKQR
jgi:hypothetical protein